MYSRSIHTLVRRAEMRACVCVCVRVCVCVFVCCSEHTRGNSKQLVGRSEEHPREIYLYVRDLSCSKTRTSISDGSREKLYRPPPFMPSKRQEVTLGFPRKRSSYSLAIFSSSFFSRHVPIALRRTSCYIVYQRKLISLPV